MCRLIFVKIRTIQNQKFQLPLLVMNGIHWTQTDIYGRAYIQVGKYQVCRKHTYIRILKVFKPINIRLLFHIHFYSRRFRLQNNSRGLCGGKKRHNCGSAITPIYQPAQRTCMYYGTCTSTLRGHLSYALRHSGA